MRLNLTFAALAIACATASPVVAADAVLPLVLPGSWQGPYVGAHLGVRWLNDSEVGANWIKFGAHGGMLAGHLWQHRGFVGGIEADVGIGPTESRSLRGCPGPNNCAANGEVSRNQIDGHLRVLAGPAYQDRAFFFFSAGIAVSTASAGIFSEVSGTGGHVYDEDVTIKKVWGTSFGGGLELRHSSRLRLRGELLWDRYHAFDTAGDMATSAINGGCCTATYTRTDAPLTSRQTVSTARFALIYELP
jgi:opacity protein-like surface antigen